MFSYPDAQDVLRGLGDKVTEKLARAVASGRKDLRDYRRRFPAFVAEHSERGLANWIHDRLWAHLVAEFDEFPGVVLTDGEPTREIVVGLSYRLRVKRHREDGAIATYPTLTALEFFAQGVQDTFPGMDELRLVAGYEWEPDAREIGEAVLSLRDGRENVIWQVTLPEPVAAVGADPIRPTAPEPSLPHVDLLGQDTAANNDEETASE